MKKNQISAKCRLLIEEIAKGNYLNSNAILESVLSDLYNARRNYISKLVNEAEDFDVSIDENSIPEDLDELSTDDTPEDSQENSETADDNLLDDGTPADDQAEPESTDEAPESTDEAPEDALDPNEAMLDIVRIKCEINQKQIDTLLNSLFTIKSDLVSNENIPVNSNKFIEIDTKISYLSGKLNELKAKTIEVIDQNEVKKRIDAVKEIVDSLKNELE